MSMSTAAIDRDSFSTELQLLALRVKANTCSNYLREWKEYLFKRPKFKSVYDSDSPEYKLVVLDESISDTSLATIPSELKEKHMNNDVTIVNYTMKIGYEHLTAEQVLKQLLPASITEIPSAFEQAGHIAHMNLRPEALPYKHTIGKVILDKNPAIKVVINKLGNIETEFRTFPLEIIAGGTGNRDQDLTVTLKESNCTFTFNFAEVYWNSRLQMEHDRVIDLIRNHHLAQHNNKPTIVFDMMAGVGPFAVPLAMPPQHHANSNEGGKGEKGKEAAEKKAIAKVKIPSIQVYANDLNPASYKYLVINAQKNKCGDRLRSFNLDGRLFIRQLVSELGLWPHEVIMNLPNNATDFLDEFIGLANLLPTAPSSGLSRPRVHVYGFSTHPTDMLLDFTTRVAGIIGCELSILQHEENNCRLVRDVAPKKGMVCLSFYVPEEVLLRERAVEVCGKRKAEDEAEF